MRGAAIKTPAVTTLQDRPFAAFTDGQVDRARRPRHERNGPAASGPSHDFRGVTNLMAARLGNRSWH